MKEYHYAKTGKEVPHTCRTCEFNFSSGKCAGGDYAHEETGTPYKYGEAIDKSRIDTPCPRWGISYDAFCETIECKRGY